MAEVYLLLGPEEGEKNNLIREKRKQVLAAHPDAECYSFFVGDDDEASYISAVSQSSLFSSWRFIVLRGFESIKKTDQVYLQTIEAVKSGQSDLTLIIVSTESSTFSFDKALTAAAGKENTRIFWELTESEKKGWIVRKAKDEGFTITPDAVDEILSTVENNTEEMKNLLSSITNFLRLQGKKNTIDRDDIEAYSTASKGENGYTLFRALGEGDLDRALRIVNSILLNDTAGMLPAVTVCANQFRRIEEALRMREKRIPDAKIFSELVSFSTYTSAFKPRPGVTFKEKDLFLKAMANYTLEDVKRIILLLGKADTEVKSASADTLKIISELLVYTIIVGKGRETPLSLENGPLVPDPFRS
jgi:DNA polymerase III subunit delta